MPVPTFLTSVLGWLRAGYPQGVPATDYVPLLVVLARRLSHDEIREVAAELVRSGTLPADNADIGTLITKVTDELPSENDIARVRMRLTAGGWPLADPHTA